MSTNIPPNWYLISQALGDAIGYPKSDQDQERLGCSTQELRELYEAFHKDHDKHLTDKEKQVILNCLDGALYYVDIDIPSLYDVSEAELRQFKENLEEQWRMSSAYGQVS